MTRGFCLLAQLSGFNPLNPAAPVAKSTGLVFQDVLAIIATGLALGLVLLLWARIYVRNRRRRHHHHHQAPEAVSSPVTASLEDDSEEGHSPHGRRRRRRRRRRVHRPRNPTLGETGGLPPPRTEPTSNPPL